MRINLFFAFSPIIMGLSNCLNTPEACSVDQTFKERYEYHYNLIKDKYTKDTVVTNIEIRSIIFLSHLTGIDSKVAYGDITDYRDYEDFKTDMKNWDQWYLSNKCKISGEFIDSLEFQVISSTSWMKLPER